MSIPITSPARLFEAIDREQAVQLQAHLDDPGTHYLVLYSGSDGSQIAVMPVGPNCMFTNLSLLDGREIEGLKPVSAARTRFAPTLEVRFLSDLWMHFGQTRLDGTAFRNFALEMREMPAQEKESLLLEILARLRMFHQDLAQMLSQPLEEIESGRHSDGVGMPAGLRTLMIERFHEAREHLALVEQREQFLREREHSLIAGIEQRALVASAAPFPAPVHAPLAYRKSGPV
ncbi:MAG: hypothetical protein K0R17_4023 [Rariglobus sp.]|jgi:hypothetical protein|nr:hypothetical protein [Rariglobus sp.]